MQYGTAQGFRRARGKTQSFWVCDLASLQDSLQARVDRGMVVLRAEKQPLVASPVAEARWSTEKGKANRGMKKKMPGRGKVLLRG